MKIGSCGDEEPGATDKKKKKKKKKKWCVEAVHDGSYVIRRYVATPHQGY